ncbi:MAG: tetratricopeptide repeat protein [Candidatus Eiseniibacteriota bacterium]
MSIPTCTVMMIASTAIAGARDARRSSAWRRQRVRGSALHRRQPLSCRAARLTCAIVLAMLGVASGAGSVVVAQPADGAPDTPALPPGAPADTTDVSALTESAATSSPARSGAIALTVDLEVPRRLLAMIDRGTATDGELDAWLDLPGHREVLARGVPRSHLRDGAAAVVEGAVDPLRQPLGMPGTVRMEPLDAWRRALDWIARHRERITGLAAREVAPYVRPGVEIPPLTVYFHLAGGWDARTSDAIYVNLTRLLDTEAPLVEGVEGIVTRELAGAVLDAGLVPFVDFASVDAALLTCLHQTVRQGAARYLERRAMRAVYPDGSFAADRLRQVVEADRRLDDAMGDLDRLVATAVAGRGAAVESLLVDTMSDETLPAIGELICRTVAGAHGPDSLVAALYQGPTHLFRAYETIAVARADLPDLPLALDARLDSLALGVERRWLLADAGRREAFDAFDAGDYAGALVPLRRIQEAMPGNPVDAYNLACALSMTGAADEAMRWLEEAVRLGFRDPRHMQSDTDLEPLRAREDYQALIARLESGTEEGP